MTSAVVASKYRWITAGPTTRMAPAVVACLVLVALSLGWAHSSEEYLTPESGVGYWLGIVGGLMMLTLLAYSYRKRHSSMRRFGSVPTWFRLHMLLGVTGPVLIAFHSNFRLGALNSNVAFFTMATVATSGVVGRYIYGRIHIGLYGRKAEAAEIRADLETLRQEFGDKNAVAKPLFDALDEFGRRIIDEPPPSALQSLRVGAQHAARAWMMRIRLRKEIRDLAEVEGHAKDWSWWQKRRRAAELARITAVYFDAVLKAAELRFYERLFAQWHILHLPLFFLMVMAALVHVWAVHKYQ